MRDQHTEPVPRFGGIALFWGFVGTLFLLWWLPFEQHGLGLELSPENRVVGLCLGGLLSWGIGFARRHFLSAGTLEAGGTNRSGRTGNRIGF